jgi:hypothetical protein
VPRLQEAVQHPFELVLERTLMKFFYDVVDSQDYIFVTRLNIQEAAQILGRPYKDLEEELSYSEEAGNHHLRITINHK